MHCIGGRVSIPARPTLLNIFQIYLENFYFKDCRLLVHFALVHFTFMWHTMYPDQMLPAKQVFWPSKRSLQLVARARPFSSNDPIFELSSAEYLLSCSTTTLFLLWIKMSPILIFWAFCNLYSSISHYINIPRVRGGTSERVIERARLDCERVQTIFELLSRIFVELYY
jgi:hypothetical protein